MTTPAHAACLRAWATRLERGQERLTPLHASLAERDRQAQLASAARLRAKADAIMRAFAPETEGAGA